ncbi:MAG TPA: hypothetical protein VG144_01040 [Gaiellaceae bacterium]|nr:hypothetical protein [Gaiellaceae bacterium]
MSEAPPLGFIGVDDGVLVGAVVAALGYVGKEGVQTLRAWRRDREERRVRLNRLQALLRASRIAFVVQCAQRDRLAELLRNRFRNELPEEAGFERLFTQFYDRFDDEERDLHAVVRGYTEHALRPINQAMRDWLENDSEHRTTHGKTGVEAGFAEQLNALDAHLLLWLAKYETWIPGRPQHALVYLADEAAHGLGFPTGIEDTLAQILTR